VKILRHCGKDLLKSDRRLYLIAKVLKNFDIVYILISTLLRFKVIARFLDIGGIDDHHSLNFLVIIYLFNIMY
jgi:hypothetical protein